IAYFRGYVLVGQELQSLLNAMGFDPYLGVYHQVDYGRPSLALYLLEEFRAPLVDRLRATLVSTGVLKRGDFVGTLEGGVQLDARSDEALLRRLREGAQRAACPSPAQLALSPPG